MISFRVNLVNCIRLPCQFTIRANLESYDRGVCAGRSAGEYALPDKPEKGRNKHGKRGDVRDHKDHQHLDGKKWQNRFRQGFDLYPEMLDATNRTKPIGGVTRPTVRLTDMIYGEVGRDERQAQQKLEPI